MAEEGGKKGKGRRGGAKEEMREERRYIWARSDQIEFRYPQCFRVCAVVEV
jgi:hypothetical protein